MENFTEWVFGGQSPSSSWKNYFGSSKYLLPTFLVSSSFRPWSSYLGFTYQISLHRTWIENEWLKDIRTIALDGMVVLAAVIRLLSSCGLQDNSVSVQCPGGQQQWGKLRGQASVEVALVSHQPNFGNSGCSLATLSLPLLSVWHFKFASHEIYIFWVLGI